MSLDVYLIKNISDHQIATYNLAEMDHLRANYEISREHGGNMSFGGFVRSLPNGWRAIANRDDPNWGQANEQLYWANITHNLGKMAGEAGIYEALWRPEELGFDTANQIIPLLTEGLAKLKADPEKYKKFDSPNGWSLYIHFVPFVEKYLDACLENPDAIIEVSR